MKIFKFTAAVALATLPLLGSCAQEEESLIVAGAPQWNGACAVQVPAQVYLARGFLDIRFETEYIVPMELQNQLQPQQPMMVNSGTDNSELQLVGIDVSLSSRQRPDLIDRLEAAGGSYVDFSPAVPTNSLPGGGSSGYLVTGIPAATAGLLSQYRVEEALLAGDDAAAMATGTPEEIDAARSAAMNGVLNRSETFEVNISVRARRTGNSVGDVGEIEAREFTFPVDLCHGCLISCAACTLDVDNDGDGTTDETLTGLCPPTVVPTDPTERTFRNDFSGLNVGCPSAQDDTFVPLGCAG